MCDLPTFSAALSVLQFGQGGPSAPFEAEEPLPEKPQEAKAPNRNATLDAQQRARASRGRATQTILAKNVGAADRAGRRTLLGGKANPKMMGITGQYAASNVLNQSPMTQGQDVLRTTLGGGS